MISFPPYLKSGVSIRSKKKDQLSIDQLMNYIADSLIQENAVIVDRDETTINFKSSLCRPFFGPGWKLLVPISTGKLSFKKENSEVHIGYKLSFEKLIITATILMVPIAFFIIYDQALREWEKVLGLVVIWTWLIGCNIAFTAFRFPGFLKRSSREAEEQFYFWEKK